MQELEGERVCKAAREGGGKERTISVPLERRREKGAKGLKGERQAVEQKKKAGPTSPILSSEKEEGIRRTSRKGRKK